MTQRSTLYSRVLAWRMRQTNVLPSGGKLPDTATFAIEPDWEELRALLREECTTRMLYWKDYVKANKGLPTFGYSQFCRRFVVWSELNNKELIEPDWNWVAMQVEQGQTRYELWRIYSHDCVEAGHLCHSYNTYCRRFNSWLKHQNH